MTGQQALEEATGDKAYDELDDGIRAGMTHKEWLWLSDAGKARLVQNLTEPETYDD